ncbi:MAG: DUF4271 domain-containing protein [Bacteroidetes bacterium]|nr:DUF4271 domain-containing protein [Bacteroidota bacterium]MBU1720474.1 DUF4271 domain-containing protein [Bacteroidota bacterium]
MPETIDFTFPVSFHPGENDSSNGVGLLHPRFSFVPPTLPKDTIHIQEAKSLFEGHSYSPTGPFQNALSRSNPDWYTGIFMIILVLFVSVRIVWGKRYRQIYSAFVASRFLSQLSREGGVFYHKGSITLFISFSMISGMMFYAFGISLGLISANILYYAIITACVAAIYLLKLLLFSFLGSIFQAEKELREYLQHVFIFNEIIGLLIFVPVLFSFYTHSVISLAGLQISGGLMVLIYFFRLIRGVMIISRHIKFSKFHLFLYLCTLEILPMLTLIKFARIFTGDLI